MIAGTGDKWVGYRCAEVHGLSHQRLLLLTEQRIIVGRTGCQHQRGKQIYDSSYLHLL